MTVRERRAPNLHTLPGDDRLWRELAAGVAPAPRWTAGRLASVAAVLMVCAGAAALALLQAPEAAPVAIQFPGLEHELDVRVDVHQDDGRPLAASTMPDKPSETWARPPCLPGYVERKGACWVLAANRPPCPKGMYVDEGRCYVPVARGARPPTSVNP